MKGHRFGVLICEDLWHQGPIQQLVQAGAKSILCLNASPYSYLKSSLRAQILKTRTEEARVPIFYVNQIGGQDELVFDGDTQVIDAQGHQCAHAGWFEEKLLIVDMSEKGEITQQSFATSMPKLESIYKALVLGTRDYVLKNHFSGVLLGLSGGIDSALVLAIAVDALGADRVTAILMPSQYTASMSNEEAIAEAKTLGVRYHTIPINTVYDAFMHTLNPVFKGTKPDITEENLQARIRGTLLMALSNKMGSLVLSTSNKSEAAVGYSTLYGDMAGGFCPIKDVYKTIVYQLAHYRNQQSPVIPTRVIDRPPSAELAPNQKDEDTLPAYAILDQILEQFIDQEKTVPDIIKAGFNQEIVYKVAKMIQRSEYKRWQAAPGIRITEKAFGKDWRYPVTSAFEERGLRE
ncbi:MAG TPA: NAD+ synthase [Coxiellaceae bacterium]|nr:NAD+ synthase [Coxiellaceae bacterium]